MGVELFDPIKTASAVSDSVIVSFSGGKESIVVLDMCMRYFERVAAFHMYQFPHLSFSDEQIDWYERRYPGLEIIDLPHPNLSMNMHYGVFRPENPDVPLIGFNDVYNYVRWATGIHWIAAGERVSDSLVRRAMIKHNGTVDTVRGRFYPVANWNKADILRYIKVHKLRIGKDSRAMGYSFPGIEQEAVTELKRHFPRDYERIESWFPLLGAAVFRQENLKRYEWKK